MRLAMMGMGIWLYTPGTAQMSSTNLGAWYRGTGNRLTKYIIAGARYRTRRRIRLHTAMPASQLSGTYRDILNEKGRLNDIRTRESSVRDY